MDRERPVTADPVAPLAPLAPPGSVLSAVPHAAWSTLGAFVFRHNRTADGRVRCLHGDQGDDEAGHVAELAGLRAGEAAFWRASGADGRTLGVVGCEIDVVQRRVWLRGPWTAPGCPASLDATLLHALEQALPDVERLDAFPGEDDEPLAALYGGAGYRRMDVHRVMQASLGTAATPTEADARIRPAQPEDLRHWLPLHHGLFPGSYLSDDDIAATVGDGSHRVLTAWVDGRAAGYLVATDDTTADELYVDYLGVDPAFRCRGLGRALLRDALRWGTVQGRRRAALTVRQDRGEALSLYLQCGFRQTRAGVHWRMDRGQTAPSARPGD